MKSSTALFIIWFIMTIILYQLYISSVHNSNMLGNQTKFNQQNIQIYQNIIANQNIIISQKSTRHAIEKAIERKQLKGLYEIAPTNIIITKNE